MKDTGRTTAAVGPAQPGQNNLGRGGMSEEFFLQTGAASWGEAVGRGVEVRHVVFVGAVCGHMRHRDSCDRGAVVGIVPDLVCERHARGEI